MTWRRQSAMCRGNLIDRDGPGKNFASDFVPALLHHPPRENYLKRVKKKTHTYTHTRARELIGRVYNRSSSRSGTCFSPNFSPVLPLLLIQSHSLHKHEIFCGCGTSRHSSNLRVLPKSSVVRDELRSRLRASAVAPSAPILFSEYT
jgi:hypothetical protein